MMFRPKFCCNCGEKIERAEWRVWTSRRFCELCATDYKHIDMFPFAFVGLGAFLAVLGFGSYFRSPSEPSVTRLSQPALVRQLKPAGHSSPATMTVEESGSNVAIPALPTGANNTVRNTEQPVRGSNTSENAVFYCGAITKKGTPCTRRVKSKGFCWQHAKTGQVVPSRF